jgi:DNA polymerase III alpha subunit
MKTYDILNNAPNKLLNQGNFIIDNIIVHNSIPDVIKNRDDKTDKWKAELKHLSNDIYNILQTTYGKIVFQEQLANIWQIVGGFTATEAQEARKSVAKKWVEKLKPIKQKWITGATTTLGYDEAIKWWDDMESFGRYAFNKSHSVAYSLVAYRCLYLKTYYPAEWWATVMTRCHRQKLTRFMEVARSENVRFGIFDPNHLTGDFTVLKDNDGSDYISPGLLGVKGVKSKATVYEGKGDFTNIDDFINAKGAHKVTMERLIKLGTFSRMEGHSNIKATWMWYLYAYTKDTKVRSEIKAQLLEVQGWDQNTIREEIERQAKEYRILYPKRNKIPTKILNWKPKPNDDRESVMKLVVNDYTLSELLAFEKDYLGYYLRSPLDMYKLSGLTISSAKKYFKNNAGAESYKTIARIECVVQNAYIGQTKDKKSTFARLAITDGKLTASVFCWEKELDDIVAQWYHKENSIDLLFVVGKLMSEGKEEEATQFYSDVYDSYLKYITSKGVKISVVYNEQRSTYSIAKRTPITFLELRAT